MTTGGRVHFRVRSFYKELTVAFLLLGNSLRLHHRQSIVTTINTCCKQMCILAKIAKDEFLL